MYWRELSLPTAPNFQVSVSNFPIVETDYGVALKEELTVARTLANKNLKASQKQQKSIMTRRLRIVN